MRKLASIQKIISLNPIPGADKIEVARILGWDVVVQKGEFKPGDLVIYCEIDSILPEKKEYEFLRKSCYKPSYRGFRIRTIRLRKQLSQGIVFSTEILNIKIKEGLEVTDILGIRKYDTEIKLEKQHEKPKPWYIRWLWCLGILKRRKARPWPIEVPHTDEERIQSVPWLIDKMQGKDCYITTKIDGTSGTFANCNGKIYICSRNIIKRKNPNDKYWQIANRYDIINILKKNKNIAIQGEIAGPSIQKNRLNLKISELFVFNVFDIKKGEYFGYQKFKDFCEKYNLSIVPVIYEGKFDYTLDTLLTAAKGTYAGTDHQREGIVIREIVDSYRVSLRNEISFKVINNLYLLKKE